MGKERERLRERVGKRERQRWRVGERELNGTGTETVGESDRGEIAMGIAMKNRVGERQRKRESLERESSERVVITTYTITFHYHHEKYTHTRSEREFSHDSGSVIKHQGLQ